MTVTEGNNITLVCLGSSFSDEDGITWRREDGRTLDEKKRLIIVNAKVTDAGKYTCRTRGSNQLKHTIMLNVLVNVKVEMSLKVLNWSYTEELQDKDSQYYKNFTTNFINQMDTIYKNLTGYVGIDILNITQGSVKVKFRVRVVVVVRKPTESSAEVKVKVGKRIIIEAKTGLVGNLLVDRSPENFQIDAPLPAPGQPDVAEVHSDKVLLRWDHPDDAEYYGDVNAYVIKFWKFGLEEDADSREIGRVTSYRLVGLISDKRYRLQIAGINKKNGEGLFTDIVNFRTKRAEFPWQVTVVVVLAVIACGSFIICIAVIILRRRRRRGREAGNVIESGPVCTGEMQMDEIAEVRNNPEPVSFPPNVTKKEHLGKLLKVPRDRVTLMQELGAGEFGIVYKAQLKKGEGHIVTCAVKTLKAGALAEELRDLMNELNVMTTVGYHPNLVNLIGACVAECPIYIILEFAVHGQLLRYLQQRKAEFRIDQNARIRMGENEKFSIARDVAAGMEHLAKHKCLHRDLAARNVLLGENYVAKIADFGMSRDIYERGVYERKTGHKLPVRWMALEAIETLAFTAETDIWSFGVLLWEIEAAGLNPYEGMSVGCLIEYLKSGKRLEQPNGCSDEMYRIMQDCWSAAPRHRPNFSQLHARLEALINTVQEQW